MVADWAKSKALIYSAIVPSLLYARAEAYSISMLDVAFKWFRTSPCFIVCDVIAGIILAIYF